MENLTLVMWQETMKDDKMDREDKKWRSLEAKQALEYANWWFQDNGLSHTPSQELLVDQIAFCDSYYEILTHSGNQDCYQKAELRFNEVRRRIKSRYKLDMPSFISVKS